MSRRSRKRFSGTGGISSGRTTGFSLLLCSLSPSPSLSSSSASPSAGLQGLFIQVDAKECFVMQRRRRACGARVTVQKHQRLLFLYY